MSEIVSFYNNTNILLTGATGFIGKLLVEQLLRKSEPKMLYLLIRNKKNEHPELRIEKIFKEIVFDRLRNEKPNFYEKVKVISGDLAESNLGINDELLKEIIENVEVVIHSGATVKFDEPLVVATNINVKGTLSIVQLCHQIRNLKAFTYTSTIFSNCIHQDIYENFYDVDIACDELITCVDKLGEDEVENLKRKILSKWPNTYAFTKAVAENVVKIYAMHLPTAIVRPPIVIGTLHEPISGWIDNNSQATACFTAGVALGIIRTAKMSSNYNTEVMPGDMVASCILAATYKSSFKGSIKGATIYNLATNSNNKITWGEFINSIAENAQASSPERLIWRPSICILTNRILYKILSFIMHFLPAFVMDKIEFITGKPQRALKIYKSINKFLDSIEYFCVTTWNFSYENTTNLWQDLNDEDKRLFNFDTKSIDWPTCLKSNYKGVLLNLLKQKKQNL